MVQLQWYAYPLAILAGALAGAINTLAGSGSLIALPMLIFLGLPANVANGSNRIGVLVQNLVGFRTYQASGKANLKGWFWLVIPGALGSIIGAQIAVNLDQKAINMAIGVVMVLMLLVVLLDPQRWLRVHSEVREGRPGIPLMLLFLAIGIYGGFIQAGVSLFVLAALVMGVGYNLSDGNAVKLLIVLTFNITAFVIFILNAQVNWWLGGLLAVGQSLGAWGAARFATKSKNANQWIRWLLIVVLVFTALKLFGLLPF